jgi:hypothetical protein
MSVSSAVSAFLTLPALAPTWYRAFESPFALKGRSSRACCLATTVHG